MNAVNIKNHTQKKIKGENENIKVDMKSRGTFILLLLLCACNINKQLNAFLSFTRFTHHEFNEKLRLIAMTITFNQFACIFKNVAVFQSHPFCRNSFLLFLYYCESEDF